MGLLEERIEKLRSLTAEASDLSEVAVYFHDELGNDPRMHDLSVDVKHRTLTRAVEGALQQALSSKARLKKTVVLKVSRTDFLHGAGSFGGTMVVFFLFEKDGRGLVTTSSTPTHFLRISLVTLPGGAHPAPGPRGRSN